MNSNRLLCASIFYNAACGEKSTGTLLVVELLNLFVDRGRLALEFFLRLRSLLNRRLRSARIIRLAFQLQHRLGRAGAVIVSGNDGLLVVEHGFIGIAGVRLELIL